MKPQFRIREENDKFYVEYLHRKKSFFKKEIWNPYITWAGSSKIYAHSSLKSAEDNLKLEVIFNTITNQIKI